jgi:hypothetical protein
MMVGTGTAPFNLQIHAAVAVSGGVNPYANLMSLYAVVRTSRLIGAKFQPAVTKGGAR